MIIDTKNLISLSEANQNFSKVAKQVEKTGSVVILKNNKPKFVVMDCDDANFFALTDDEKIDIVAKRVFERFRPAFEELANKKECDCPSTCHSERSEESQ